MHERYPINRPDALNAINLQATQEFCDIVNRISSDQSVRAVVLTGTGERAFCAGGDVAEFAASGDGIENLIREMTGVLHVGISRLAWLRAPAGHGSVMERETRVIAQMSRTKDAREGISAFVVKRKPQFIGE